MKQIRIGDYDIEVDGNSVIISPLQGESIMTTLWAFEDHIDKFYETQAL